MPATLEVGQRYRDPDRKRYLLLEKAIPNTPGEFYCRTSVRCASSVSCGTHWRRTLRPMNTAEILRWIKHHKAERVARNLTTIPVPNA